MASMSKKRSCSQAGSANAALPPAKKRRSDKSSHYNEADAVEIDQASFNTATEYLKLSKRRDGTFRDQRCWVAYTLQCNQHVDCRWKAKFAGVGETVWQMENGMSHSPRLSPRYLNKKHRERLLLLLFSSLLMLLLLLLLSLWLLTLLSLLFVCAVVIVAVAVAVVLALLLLPLLLLLLLFSTVRPIRL